MGQGSAGWVTLGDAAKAALDEEARRERDAGDDVNATAPRSVREKCRAQQTLAARHLELDLSSILPITTTWLQQLWTRSELYVRGKQWLALYLAQRAATSTHQFFTSAATCSGGMFVARPFREARRIGSKWYRRDLLHVISSSQC